MQTGYKVIDVMTRKPVTAAPTASLRELAQKMRDERVGSLLLREGNQLVGIVTEYDLVRKGVASGKDLDKTQGRDIMTPADKMHTTSPGVDIFAALNTMRDHECRHLPVLDDGKMIGFITLKDILRIQPQLFDLIVDKYDVREPEHKPLRGALDEGDNA
ncbi:CBS domain-containing protein [Candidatus Woesearchaeota archaeon]|nr:MAG: CBS domain-containing protein [Candidatus Woesearchaeota archaeon]